MVVVVQCSAMVVVVVVHCTPLYCTALHWWLYKYSAEPPSVYKDWDEEGLADNGQVSKAREVTGLCQGAGWQTSGGKIISFFGRGFPED